MTALSMKVAEFGQQLHALRPLSAAFLHPSTSRLAENLWMQSKLLHSPVTDLSHIQLVFVATIDGIDGAELLR